ncbi:MAG: iron-containing alcohol dehydrogenase [Clostridia bacterium]|nr:iron-containing alcohol dehydrogenase [Clostridia bacterium]
MFFVKAAFCRVFQLGFRAVLPVLPYREPEILSSCGDIPGVLVKERADNVLIVTDKGIVANGLLAPIEEALTACNIDYTVYDGTRPNPSVTNVADALALYQTNGCKALIAVGGGSAMDCAKAVGARLAHPRKSLRQMKGILRVWRKLPPLIAVPTTAGTGSEVTLAAVVTDSEKKDKYALMSFPLIPKYAVLDAGLTVSLPKGLTATTSMDALTHAVEAYIGRSTTRHTREYALEATRLVFAHLQEAYEDGTNLEARKAMLTAAYKAGEAFSQSYVGYIHAVAHSLGGFYGTPHGLANAVIMPYVLDVYGAHAYKKLHALGVAAGVCTEAVSHKEGAEAFIRAIREMNKAMNIPEKLQGIDKADIPALARHAEKEANPLYPVPMLMTARELEAIYHTVADWSEQKA